MKKALLFLIWSVLIQSVQAQTSIANGNWTMPLTWDCTCVPLPGATVTVAHAVILNTDWITNNGSITIENGASLIQDATGRDIQIAGGFITNNGTFDIQYIYNQAGTMTNNGSLEVASFLNMDVFENTGTVTGVDSIYTDGTLTNSGSMEVFTFYNADQLTNTGMIINVDSMSNAGTLMNSIGAEIHADSATNSGIFTNDGLCAHIAMTNSGTFTNNNSIWLNDFTNWGTFDNHDSIVATGSMTNGGDFVNYENAVVDLDVSFLNSNVISNDASFENNGYLGVGDSWYNFDFFSGNANGWVEVQDTSANMGTMTGNFDLCDYTPNTIVPDQSQGTGMDYSSGTVDNTITWCMVTQVDQFETPSFEMYPNPANDLVMLRGISGNAVLEIFNVEGKRLMSHSVQNRLSTSEWPAGVYMLRVIEDDRIATGRIVIAH